MTEKLNTLALGTSAAIVAGLSMLLLGILGNFGIYQGAVEMMNQWHMFFSLTPFGIFTGIIEAAVISFVFFYIFGWVYNETPRSKLRGISTKDISNNNAASSGVFTLRENKFTNLSESIEGGD